MSQKKGNSNFLVQGSILAVASIISRVIGLIYRIPMTAIIGDVGNNYYGCAFEIYNVMLIISSYSLPTAVSKLVSAQVAQKKRKQAYQILKGGIVFALISGTIVALIVYYGAEFLTGTLLHDPYSVFALRVLAPALIVVAVLGVLRGYFQGLGTMMPSAISQIIEQIVNAIVSVWAAYVLYHYGERVGAVLGNPDKYAAAYGASGGTLGTNLGSVAALIVVIVIFLGYRKVLERQLRKERNVKLDSFAYTMKVLVVTILPILLSTTVYNISGIVDQGIFKNLAPHLGMTLDEIEVLWGVYSGKYKLMTNVPIAIASALAASSVPALTRSFSEGDMDRVKSEIHAATRFIMAISLPCAVGLAVLATPIFTLLFPGTVNTVDLATRMMWVGAVAVIFYSLSTLSNGLLQGINRLKVPVINAVIALITHVILLVILMLLFHLDIYAVVIANTFFAFMMYLLNAYSLKKYSGYHQEVVKTFLIPALCSAVMGVLTGLVYAGLYKVTGSNAFSVIFAIVFAVLLYGILMIISGGLTEQELKKIPMGGKIAAIADRYHLLKK